MNYELLNYLCDPRTGGPLELRVTTETPDGRIESGFLKASDGTTFEIKAGIPRFSSLGTKPADVESFGDEWNFFNFAMYRDSWLNHTIKNTFGSAAAFKGKVVVDAGAGSGAQTLWMLQSGAKHVIALELSHSVDDVMMRNLRDSGFKNYDVIQCSIDSPPLRPSSIDGIVMCHNVIQHTVSVEATAKALWSLVSSGGEFVFNCYKKNDEGLFRWVRFNFFFRPIRALLSKQSFNMILSYATLMAALGLIPILGRGLEKLSLMSIGDQSVFNKLPFTERIKKRFTSTRLNTFDMFGSHQFNHVKTDEEIKRLVKALQPNENKVLNATHYFSRPQPVGCALRLQK